MLDQSFACQGSMTSMPQPSKSLTFLVASDAQLVGGVAVDPGKHPRIWALAHDLGNDVGVEDDHACGPHSGKAGTRMGSRGAISSSSQPHGAKSS